MVAPRERKGDFRQATPSPRGYICTLIAVNSHMARNPAKSDSRTTAVEEKEAEVNPGQQLEIVRGMPGVYGVNSREGVSENVYMG